MNRKEIIAANEISELISAQLNGYEQKILIEGKIANLPVLITLHGGPGTPIPFSAGCRGLFKEFTDNFIMVYWDQLGCGINNRVIDDSFSIESFIKMAEDLLLFIRKKFPNNKVLVFSSSWGTVLSAELAKRHPSEIDAVIASGQIIKNVLINAEAKKCLENSDIPNKKLEKINAITAEKPTKKELSLISGALRKYTDAYENKSGRKAPMGPVIKGLLTSPDYSLRDFQAIIMNGYMKNSSLWNELLRIDLTDTVSGTAIPYIILQGDTDVVAPVNIVKEVVEKSGNANIKLHIVENSGHQPGADMMDAVFAALTKTASAL